MGVKHLPDLMRPIAVDILEHVCELKEELVRILLAGVIHVVDLAFIRSEERICLARLHMVVHGGVDIVKSPVATLRLQAFITGAVLTFVFAVQPILLGQASQGAENAVVSRCGASVVTVDEVAVEFRRVQQALQHSVAVALEATVFQSFGLVYAPGRFFWSHKRPSFTNATVDDTSEISDFANCRHGCIGFGLLCCICCERVLGQRPALSDCVNLGRY